MKSRLISTMIYGLCAGFGMALLLYPFFIPVIANNSRAGITKVSQMPLMMTLLMGLVLLVLLFEIQGKVMNAKVVALLGVLVAINSTLRFLEVAIPGPGGFSPIFFLIILTGYVFGASIGFLMGSLTMLVSALVTGGVGPWLPSQMFVAGWVGLTAPLCRPIVERLQLKGKSGEVIVLAGFGVVWGFGYGALMNLWTWPFIMGPADQYWAPGISALETLQRYTAYYLITSAVWDILAAAGNLILLIFLGKPALRILRRFKHRFAFRYIPAASRPVSPVIAPE